MLSSILQNFSSSLTTVHSLLSPPSAHSDRLTLSDLNDDVLLHICGFLTIYATQDYGSRQHNRYIKPLSLVNRRLHEITSIILFKSFIVSAKDDRNDGDWEAGRRFILDLLH
ncbi:hypothetical protein BU24DRAFT_416836 [Aaosphaeria arxii CBS 175.79]|uniref:F-box domain-containing protein n=1 Tax=Aaosphaeria arxii CBS 175.79 TaxID=1450172 RepID=A0A6A5Y6I0_9PLEO|nr:uncharacterized protein BU24DRAFT_416836 [Aaosphaeria arxii CBS 175.79]KAF2021175.1 hypothetical protein BU24DRAFT_416836 [Aaosphaeria arxii CBS 175.79]